MSARWVGFMDEPVGEAPIPIDEVCGMVLQEITVTPKGELKLLRFAIVGAGGGKSRLSMIGHGCRVCLLSGVELLWFHFLYICSLWRIRCHIGTATNTGPLIPTSFPSYVSSLLTWEVTTCAWGFSQRASALRLLVARLARMTTNRVVSQTRG